MWTTFDRYLYSRYTYVFVVFFAASMGLFAVVDGFMNLDDFQQNNEGTLSMLVRWECTTCIRAASCSIWSAPRCRSFR